MESTYIEQSTSQLPEANLYPELHYKQLVDVLHDLQFYEHETQVLF